MQDYLPGAGLLPSDGAVTVIYFDIVLCVFGAALLVPVSTFLVQVLSALPKQPLREMPEGRRPVVAVVIPAHNEASVIGDTLNSIAPQLATGDRLLVVADNCTDDTARIATACNAEVIERNDSEHRGKGYAIDFGVHHLALSPPEIVLIIDGDCRLAAHSIERLAKMCLISGRPVQALDLMHAPSGASLRTRIAEFAWVVKNQVRPLGFHRLGLPCQLMGTGMAFPWPIISTAELASGHITEDLKLGIDLASAGSPALFCPEALVTSHFPSSTAAIAAQRTRWEHGHLGVILSVAPRTFLKAVLQRNVSLLALALDLSVPPLALLLMLVLAAWIAGILFFATTGRTLPMWLATTSLAMLGLSVLLCWSAYGRQVISLGQLAYAPFYALGKIPLYLKFLISRQTEWVRSKRDIP